MNYRKRVNWFMNNGLKGYLIHVLVLLFLIILQFNVADAQKNTQQDSPIFNEGRSIYADIDTTSQRLFLVLEKGVWQYDLKGEVWSFVDSLGTFSTSLDKYEFGYNHGNNKLQLWSRGVGKVYESNVNAIDFKRVDNSTNHKNQFGHFPFFRNGTLYTFGGYGYWEWHNILTYFNQDTKEWSIQNTGSKLPERRVPFSGIYLAGKDEFYIYGGQTTKDQHPDDENASRIDLKDIWKFSFVNSEWEKVLTLDLSGNNFFKTSQLGKIGRTNASTSSFYIPEKNMWFLPVNQKNKPDRQSLLKPINIDSKDPYSAIQANVNNNNKIIPTNFFYNPKSESVVLVGIPNLSNTEEYPVKVVKIPRDSLLANLNQGLTLVSLPIYYYLIGGISIILIVIGYIFIKRNSNTTNKEQINIPVSKEELMSLSSLKEEEKKLIEFLLQKDKLMESQELEQYLWDDIESFDYRRRLRNDTIKSINDKLRKRFDTDEKLIIRKKDPADNRRYLYGLNDELIFND